MMPAALPRSSPPVIGPMRILKIVLLAVAFVYLLPVGLAVALWYAGDRPSTWRDADWTSAGLLPAARDARDAAKT